MVIRPYRELREINRTKDEFNLQHDYVSDPGMARTTSDSLLFHDPYPTATRIILLQSEGQTEHDCRTHGKNHKGIDVCQACCLPLQGLINPGVSCYLRLVLAHTGDSQVLSQTVCRIHKIGVVDADILHQPCLMKLRAARNQRGD